MTRTPFCVSTYFRTGHCLETLLVTSCASEAPCPEIQESTKGASFLDRRLQMLAWIQKLYEVERAAKPLDADERYLLRQGLSNN